MLNSIQSALRFSALLVQAREYINPVPRADRQPATPRLGFTFHFFDPEKSGMSSNLKYDGLVLLSSVNKPAFEILASEDPWVRHQTLKLRKEGAFNVLEPQKHCDAQTRLALFIAAMYRTGKNADYLNQSFENLSANVKGIVKNHQNTLGEEGLLDTEMNSAWNTHFVKQAKQVKKFPHWHELSDKVVAYLLDYPEVRRKMPKHIVQMSMSDAIGFVANRDNQGIDLNPYTAQPECYITPNLCELQAFVKKMNTLTAWMR